MKTWQEFECPKCKGEMDILCPQWDAKAICPLCQSPILVSYDFTVGDDEEEFPVYVLSVVDKSEYDNSSNDVAKATVLSSEPIFDIGDIEDLTVQDAKDFPTSQVSTSPK